MGQEELVLKIPSDESPRAPASSSNPILKKGDSNRTARALTHSRESSGASVKFVNCNSSSGSNSASSSVGHRRTLSKGSGESKVIILQSPSGEDITLSDRLSNEDDDDVDEVDLELNDDDDDDDDDIDDAEGIDNRLRVEEEEDDEGADLRMHRPVDAKSQNSDYGSFCTTPSSALDTFGPAAARSTPAATKTETAGSAGMSSTFSSKRTTGQAAAAAVASGDAAGGIGVPSGSGGGDGDPAGGAEDPDKSANNDETVMSDYQRQPLLNPSPDSCSSDDEAGANSSGYTRRKSKHPKQPSPPEQPPPPQPPQPTPQQSILIDIPDGADVEAETGGIPAEPVKTLLAFIFLFLAWVATTTSLALTHERVPEIDPLPDVFLDNVHYQPWGLDASEIIIMVATIGAFTLATFHQHRFVVLRRIFLLGGIHYFYRAITMYITVLPKADPHYKCAPKLDELTFVDIARRVVKLLSGMGLSINGQHIYCGDYIYSGHTMTLMMTYLVITEYSPKRWFLLHWFSFCVTVTGVLTLLFARGHYSIDVLIAYYITTRLWWIYHTLANNATLTARENRQHNYLSNFWWWVMFRYMEANVGRPLPKGFNWPIPAVVLRRIPYLRDCGTSNFRREQQENSSSARSPA